MRIRSVGYGIVLLGVAAASAALAQGIIQNRADYVSAMGNESSAYNHFQNLRAMCDNSPGDSASGSLGGRNAPTANVNHTCNRYTTCDGHVRTREGQRHRFVLRCR